MLQIRERDGPSRAPAAQTLALPRARAAAPAGGPAARHQAVLSAIRESGRQNIDPIRFGEPWPKGFFEAIERRTVALQDYFDKEIGRIKNSG